MNREKIIIVMKLLKTAYPRFYMDMTKEEAENTINLWIDMFKHENPELVLAAVKNLINSFKWPPTIADVKEEMLKLTETEKETPIELWNCLKKAIRNSSYNSVQEFQGLPPIVQKFVGSPTQLREWAISIDFNEGVVRGQFLKQLEILEKREKDSKLMLPEVKQLISKLLVEPPTNSTQLLN